MSDVKIVRLGTETAYLLDHVADGVFDAAIQPDQRAAFLEESSHHMFVAVCADQVVGMVSGVRYLHPDKLPSMWVNEVGVGDDWLRRGIAKRLLDAILDLAQELGCEEAWLGTESDNIAALALYRSAKGSEAAGVYFTWDTEPD